MKSLWAVSLGLSWAAPVVIGQATLVSSAPVTPTELISGPLDGPLSSFTANPNPASIGINAVGADGAPVSVHSN